MTHFVEIEHELLEDLLAIAETRVSHLENRRGVKPALNWYKQIVERVQFILDGPDMPDHKQEGSQAEFNRYIAGDR